MTTDLFFPQYSSQICYTSIINSFVTFPVDIVFCIAFSLVFIFIQIFFIFPDILTSTQESQIQMSSYHLVNALCYKIPRLNFKKPICFKIDLALEKGYQSNYENILPPLYIHIGTIHGTGTAYLRFQRGSYCSIISFM